MTDTLARLNARRAWYVPELSVWGGLEAESVLALGTETDNGSTRIVFHQFPLGGTIQEAPFANLTDHRGNTLPDSISHPVVIPIPRNAIPVALIGPPTPAGFRIAKTTSVPGDGLVALWIIEAGE